MDLKNNKTTIYITGALFGALVGLTAAYLLEKTAELEGTELHFTSKKLSKIGMRTVSYLWSLLEKGKGKF
jgi:hypothetical protein